MKCELRLPKNFREFSSEPIISNFDNLIDAEIEMAIKGKLLFSRYSTGILTASFGGMTP